MTQNIRLINQIEFYAIVGAGYAVYVSLSLFYFVLYLEAAEPESGKKDGHEVGESEVK